MNRAMDRAEFLKHAGYATVAVATPPGLVALTPEAAEASVKNRIIRVGERFLGTPYRKMNCSQFTRKTYGKAVGVWMPATWWKQHQYGYRPSRKRKGDLLIFPDDGHVGIFHGNGMVLHSSSYYNEVCISPLRYLGRYKVRRIR